MVKDDLDPIQPAEVVRMFHEEMKDEHAESTRRAEKHRLKAFLQFCEEEGIENLNDLDGRHLFEYKSWRRNGTGDGREPIKKVTLKGQLATLRRLLRFAEDINAVDKNLYERINLPKLNGSEEVSESTLKPDRAFEILDYLEQAQPSTRDHIIFLLLWKTGARTGAIRCLDLVDLDLDGNHPSLTGPAIHFVHRPDKGTPLKNKDKASRWKRISEESAYHIKNYIKFHRNEVTDEFGRKPLITTKYGRPAANTIRSSLYRVTRPCWRGEPCPHNRDIDQCDATHLDHASKCPSSRSPHDVRSGRVTYYRRQDVPRIVVEEDLDASAEILGRHYDRRSDREQAEQRSKHLEDL